MENRPIRTSDSSEPPKVFTKSEYITTLKILKALDDTAINQLADKMVATNQTALFLQLHNLAIAPVLVNPQLERMMRG